MAILDKKQQHKLRLLQDDFIYFAKHCLKLKDEDGVVRPFEINQAQHYLHDRIESQRLRTGRVRMLIVKARQMGCSTYLEGRYYHKCSMQRGKSVFILAHENDSTKKLFAMAKRFYENAPEALRPRLKNSNARELIFDQIESQYFVGTAGSPHVGRGGTIQYLHASECAFYANTDEIKTGLMQSVPDRPNTEIVIESTANGFGNMFQEMVMDAIQGKGDYEVIFMPWYWMDKYEKELTEEEKQNFKLEDDEEEIIKLFLSEYDKEKQLRKIKWRRYKIIELGRLWEFKQEYPATIHEAFVVSGDSLIRAEDIVRARQCKKQDKNAPLVMGVDPARSGDRTVIAFRRGREIPAYYCFEDMNEMRLAGILVNLIDKHKPVQVNIDIGLGYGTVDRLHELGYTMVHGIHFGEKANEPDVYRNRRAEMACLLGKWIEQEDINIPDDDAIHADLTSIPDIKYTSDGTIRLESKEKIKETFGRSPDIFDACALTFASPVHRLSKDNRLRGGGKSQASWKRAKAS